MLTNAKCQTYVVAPVSESNPYAFRIPATHHPAIGLVCPLDVRPLPASLELATAMRGVMGRRWGDRRDRRSVLIASRDTPLARIEGNEGQSLRVGHVAGDPHAPFEGRFLIEWRLAWNLVGDVRTMFVSRWWRLEPRFHDGKRRDVDLTPLEVVSRPIEAEHERLLVSLALGRRLVSFALVPA